MFQLRFSDLERDPLGPRFWRVAGLPGEDHRAGEIGLFCGYDDNLCIIRFRDGKEELFTPHQLFRWDGPLCG
jgi:hypothetical protein